MLAKAANKSRTDSRRRAPTRQKPKTKRKPATRSEKKPSRDEGQSGMAGKQGRPTLAPRTVDQDWIQGRLKQRHKHQKDLAAAWGGKSASAVTRALRGARQLSLDEFMTLCDFLATRPSELLPRLGYDLPSTVQGVVIAGEVTSQAQVTFVSAAAGRRAPIPAPDPTSRALIVRAKSGPLAAYNGAMVLYDESAGKMPVYDRLAVVEVDGEVVPLLGVLSRGEKAGTMQLTRFATGEVQQIDQVIRTHAVAHIILN